MPAASESGSHDNENHSSIRLDDYGARQVDEVVNSEACIIYHHVFTRLPLTILTDWSCDPTEQIEAEYCFSKGKSAVPVHMYHLLTRTKGIRNVSQEEGRFGGRTCKRH